MSVVWIANPGPSIETRVVESSHLDVNTVGQIERASLQMGATSTAEFMGPRCFEIGLAKIFRRSFSVNESGLGYPLLLFKDRISAFSRRRNK